MARKKGDLAAMKSRAARSATVATVPAAPAAKPAAPKKPFNPLQFAREVRAEARRISWTPRREVWVTSVFVLIMVTLASVFFFGVDVALSWAVSALLKLANAG